MTRLRRRVAVLFVLLLLGGLLTGCDEGMAELLLEMAIEWADEKNLLSVDADGNPSVNTGQIIAYEAQRAGSWLRGEGYSTGDSELDAALDAGQVVKTVRDADNLANDGAQKRDPELIEQAIKIRPNDWQYQEQLSAVYLATGDPEAAADAQAQSENLVAQRIEEGGDCRSLTLNLLRSRLAALEAQLRQEPYDETLQAAYRATQAELAAVDTRAAGNRCGGGE
jgi:hypothetical protein